MYAPAHLQHVAAYYARRERLSRSSVMRASDVAEVGRLIDARFEDSVRETEASLASRGRIAL